MKLMIPLALPPPPHRLLHVLVPPFPTPIQQALDHILGNGQAARQPGTLDAQQIDERVESLRAFLLDVEVGEGRAGGAARAPEFGPDPAVVEVDGGGVDARQVGADELDGFGEAGGAGRERVRRGRVGDPFDVGAEADAAGHVERQVRAEAAVAGHRRGVEERRRLGVRGGVAEVRAFGVVGRDVAVGGEDGVGQRDGGQPRAVDEHVDVDAVFGFFGRRGGAEG